MNSIQPTIRSDALAIAAFAFMRLKFRAMPSKA